MAMTAEYDAQKDSFDYGFWTFIAFGFVCCVVSSVIEARLFADETK